MTRTQLAVVLLLAVLSITGCRRRAPVQGGSVTVGAPPPAANGQCQTTLAVSRVVAQAGCRIDDRVSGQTSILSYPCEGGAAQVAFGQSVFTGSVVNGVVDLAIET